MFSNIITKKLINDQIIKSSEYELYQYSINAFLEYFFNIIVTIIIGCYLGKIIQTLFFLLIVIPVRSFIGGCHAKTSSRCFCLSIMIYITCVFGVDYIYNIPISVYWIIGGICSIIIMLLAPVPSDNKPITEILKNKMKKYIRFSLICIFIVFCICIERKQENMCKELLAILCYFVFTLLIVKIKKS